MENKRQVFVASENEVSEEMKKLIEDNEMEIVIEKNLSNNIPLSLRPPSPVLANIEGKEAFRGEHKGAHQYVEKGGIWICRFCDHIL